MQANRSEEKPEIGQVIQDLERRTLNVAKRMKYFTHRRGVLLKRFGSIKSLHIRYMQQHTEMKFLLYENNAGEDFDFFEDEPYETDRKALIKTLQNFMITRAARGGYTPQLEEEETELMFKFEELVINRRKMIKLREEFLTKEEAANVRIEKLLKEIGH